MSDWTTARVVRDRDGDMWGREREGWNLISAENTEAWYPSDTCAGPQCRRKVDARGLCKAMQEFANLGATSFDSTTAMRQSFMDDRDNYHTASDHNSTKGVSQL